MITLVEDNFGVFEELFYFSNNSGIKGDSNKNTNMSSTPILVTQQHLSKLLSHCDLTT